MMRHFLLVSACTVLPIGASADVVGARSDYLVEVFGQTCLSSQVRNRTRAIGIELLTRELMVANWIVEEPGLGTFKAKSELEGISLEYQMNDAGIMTCSLSAENWSFTPRTSQSIQETLNRTFGSSSDVIIEVAGESSWKVQQRGEQDDYLVAFFDDGANSSLIIFEQD